MSIEHDDLELKHYGILRKSGRYPYGSGENPYQRSGSFTSRVSELAKAGLSEKERAEALGMSTTDLRARLAVDKSAKRAEDFVEATRLKESGYSNREIAEKLGLSGESSVRSLLARDPKELRSKAEQTSDLIKEQVDKKGIVDISKGVDTQLGVSPELLKQSEVMLRDQGYEIFSIGVPQATAPGQQTIVKVVCPEGTTYKEAYEARDAGEIHSFTDYVYSPDGGATIQKLSKPSSMDSSRVYIRYGEHGGSDRDGVIEIRRGIEDLSLGKSQYAQVRIAVDGTHFMKGMAMYSDNIPDGFDIVYNTNKKAGTKKEDVFKPFKIDDPNNPFGVLLKADGQRWYIGKDGKKKLSPINKMREEGEWNEWEKSVSSQFLSKQPIKLINNQLNLTYADKVSEYEDIMVLTNPTIKRHLLLKFSDKCDSAAVHLKAASFPRQRSQVILPIPSLKDGEVYAPNYRNGEKVALIRYPHGGPFEIPILTVNNNHRDGRKILGNALDAVGINIKVAERLSGADFDGDTVSVIPISSKNKIHSAPALSGLKDFDPKKAYPGVPGSKVMTRTNYEMGRISNLITDMTLKGASDDEITKAVKHSMVVIDAEKHKLNYKQSEKDNGISQLRRKYQRTVDDNGVEHFGASTLLSRKNQKTGVPERKGSVHINKDTGEYIYKTSGRSYIDAKGKTVQAKTNVPTILAVKDTRSLSSGSTQEEAYALYSNKMKALGNEARKSMMATPRASYSRSAAKTYSKEVDSLNAKLNSVLKLAPRERRAQVIANSKIKAMLDDNPSLKAKDKSVKKFKQMAIDEARASVGVKKGDREIQITDREWKAIQAGAISDTKLESMLKYTDMKALQERAMPRSSSGELSQAKINKIKAMNNSYSITEIADALGISNSTVSKYL